MVVFMAVRACVVLAHTRERGVGSLGFIFIFRKHLISVISALAVTHSSSEFTFMHVQK
jgi:hypothetical protein